MPYFVFVGIEKLLSNVKARRTVALPVACASGALVNTLLVMHLIFFCFRDEFAAAQNVAVDAVYSLILGIIAANGVPEAIVAVVIGGAVSLALLRIAPQTAKRQEKALKASLYMVKNHLEERISYATREKHSIGGNRQYCGL